MIAKTPIYEVIAIKKKTKTRVLENMKVGDRFVISVVIKYPGRGSSGVYASTFNLKNLTNGESAHFCFYDMKRFEEILEWKEVTNDYSES